MWVCYRVNISLYGEVSFAYTIQLYRHASEIRKPFCTYIHMSICMYAPMSLYIYVFMYLCVYEDKYS